MAFSPSGFDANPFDSIGSQQPRFSIDGSNFLNSDFNENFCKSGQNLEAMLEQDEKNFEQLSSASSKVYDISCFSNPVVKSGITVGASMLDTGDASLLGKHVSIGEYLGRRTKPLGALDHRSEDRPSFGFPVRSPRRYEETPSVVQESFPNITDSAWIDSVPSLSESALPELNRGPAKQPQKSAPNPPPTNPSPSPWMSLNSSSGKVESWLQGSISSTEKFLKNLTLDSPSTSLKPPEQLRSSPSEEFPKSTSVRSSPKSSLQSGVSSTRSTSTVRPNDKKLEELLQPDQSLNLTWQSDEVHSSTKSGSEEDSDSRQADFRSQQPTPLPTEPLAQTYNQDLDSMINLYRDSNGSDTPGLIEKVKNYYLGQNNKPVAAKIFAVEPVEKEQIKNAAKETTLEKTKKRAPSFPNHSTPNENRVLPRVTNVPARDSVNPSAPLHDKTNEHDWLTKVPKPISKPKPVIRGQSDIVKLESKNSSVYWRGTALNSGVEQDVVIRNGSYTEPITIYAYIKESQVFQIADCNGKNNLKLLLQPREEKSVKVKFLPTAAQVYQEKINFCPKADKSSNAARMKFTVDLKGYAADSKVKLLQSDTIQLTFEKSQLSGSIVLQNMGTSPSFIRLLGFWDEEHSLTVKHSLLTIYPSQIVLRAKEQKVVQILTPYESWEGQMLHIVAVWGDEPSRQQLISFVRDGNKPNIPQSPLLEAIDFTTPFEGELERCHYKELWTSTSEDVLHFYQRLKVTQATVHLPVNEKEDSAFQTMTAEQTLAVALEETRDTTFMSEILSSGDLMGTRLSSFKRNSKAAGKVCAQINVLQFPATKVGQVVTLKLPLHNWASVTKKVTLYGLATPFLTKHRDHSMKPLCYAKIPIHFCPEKSGTFQMELNIQAEDQEDVITVQLKGEAF